MALNNADVICRDFGLGAVKLLQDYDLSDRKRSIALAESTSMPDSINCRTPVLAIRRNDERFFIINGVRMNYVEMVSIVKPNIIYQML